MTRLRGVLAAYGLDVLIVVLALASAVGTSIRSDSLRPHGAQLAFEVVAIGVMVSILLMRRWAPLAAPSTTWLVGTALSFVDGRLVVEQGPVTIAGLVAAVLLGNLPAKRQAWVGLAVVLAGSATLVYNDPAHAAGDFFFVPGLFAIGWLVGYALHERAEETEAARQRASRAEMEREAAARVAVAEERSRIARELHDVVAHAVSVMVLQVGAVRHRMPMDNAEDREALKNVEHAGRTALTEMRRLLDSMRPEGDALELTPHPGLDDLGALLQDVRATGLDVRLDVRGEPFVLPPVLDLSAYRILQEGLTNALKHSGASHAEVGVHYDEGQVVLEVRDDGRGGESSGTPGHGLVGVRERVKIYGGQMSAGRAATGGFVLRARLPVDGVGDR